MLKFTVAVALLCATAFMGECTLEKPTLSRQMTITMPKSTTMAMGGRLYTVSMTKSNVHVNSSDSSHKPCDMAFDPSENSIQDEMKVVVSGDMMYVLGEHSVERVNGKDNTKYSLMFINPHDCTLKSADLSDVNVGITPSLPRLVANGMGVDVFFPSMQTCAPCRFNNEGIKVKDTPQITPPEARGDGRIFSFDIRKLGPNYLYAQNMEGDKATMKSLDGKTMNVMKEKQVNYPVHVLANTKPEMMELCSKKRDIFIPDIMAYKEINCERINSNLNVNTAIKIPIEPYSKPISRVSYDIDKLGDKTYIGFAENKNLRVYVYDSAGQLLKSYDMGQIDEKFDKYLHRPMFYMPYAYWNVRGFIMGKEYCLVTEQVSDKHEVDLHDVRCINI